MTFANNLYKSTKPENVLHNESPYKLEAAQDGYLLKIKLPFLKDKAYKINKYGDEMVLQVGNRRKNIFLPRFVNFYKLTSDTYEPPWLIVTLGK
jgi:arsenite-transporting ATPase